MPRHSLKWLVLTGLLSASIAEGSEAPIDYSQYGKFQHIGTNKYRYTMTDRGGLSKETGAGIYPNNAGLTRDPVYKALLRDKKLDGPLEKFRPDLDPQFAYYKWASMKGTPYQALRMMNVGEALERLGEPRRALTAYYAAVVHFPREISWQNNRPWYVSVSALDAIYRLLDAHPEWDLALKDARIEITKGFDKKATNDLFKINPGKWVARSAIRDEKELGSLKHARMDGEVRLGQFANGHWELLVKGKPYLIRSICYSPSPVGRSPDLDGYKPHVDWMKMDENNNDQIDSPYDTFVDENHNERQDANEPAVGDFELMRRMGANAIRLYHGATNKALLRDLTNHYGIRVLMGDLLGAYAVGSGADWDVGTDYRDPRQRETMRRNVRKMVMDHKDEPYVLMWVLGNENNYGHGNNANKYPEEYYRFVNSVARMIHSADPNHPVALSNGELENLDMIAHLCPDVDVLAVNAYRGDMGLGESFWSDSARVWGKPVLVAEFGAPAFNEFQDRAKAEASQAEYLISNWNDIAGHAYNGRIGNAIGGSLFEWVDEWWKSGPQFEPYEHDQKPQSRGPFVGGFMYEEWLGITSQGAGTKSPYLRQLRPAYFQFKNGPWKEPMGFFTKGNNAS